MKLTVQFPELDALRRGIGARLSDWVIGSIKLDPRQTLLSILIKGIEIQLIDIGPVKFLTFQGEKVILYIKDTQTTQPTLQTEPEKSRRFHVADCRTLESIREEGRFERYVVTNRADGRFLVDWFDPESGDRGETEAALMVCMNCLEALNYRGYNGNLQGKSEIWKSFSISEFLMEYSTFFRSQPGRKDASAELNNYVHDWHRISEQRRRSAQWKCEKCQVDLSEISGSLHCHHKNGVVTDNNSSNLAVLCALCHAEQHAHQHMKVSPTERNKIKRLRSVQGIKPA